MFKVNVKLLTYEKSPYEQDEIKYVDKTTFHTNLGGCLEFINSKYQEFLLISFDENPKLKVFFSISFLNIEFDKFEKKPQPFNIVFKKFYSSDNGEKIFFCERSDNPIPAEIDLEFLYKIFSDVNFTLSETDTYMLK